jgi:hypothetical protein
VLADCPVEDFAGVGMRDVLSQGENPIGCKPGCRGV